MGSMKRSCSKNPSSSSHVLCQLAVEEHLVVGWRRFHSGGSDVLHVVAGDFVNGLILVATVMCDDSECAVEATADLGFYAGHQIRTSGRMARVSSSVLS